MQTILDKLILHKDDKYKQFQSMLIPNVPADKIIGVRAPVLRKIASEQCKKSETNEFLNSLPHVFLEENNLHAYLISAISDFDECITKVSSFLPYVDNWCTCDIIRPKCFSAQKDKLAEYIDIWISSDHTYTVRFGIEMLNTYFLDSDFKPEYLKKVADIQSDEYYITMMKAWFFATALAKQTDAALPYFEKGMIDEETRKKAIQKAVESFRIPEELKKLLKGKR
ncbi:MAG: DNA alkylation repair protein [Clostridia bacterium]|nr:DNA alkylation repair protein [Clostridia bacterium]